MSESVFHGVVGGVYDVLRSWKVRFAMFKVRNILRVSRELNKLPYRGVLDVLEMFGNSVPHEWNRPETLSVSLPVQNSLLDGSLLGHMVNICDALVSMEDAEIVMVGWSHLTKEIIDSAPNLKMVAIWATTCHYADPQAARQHGITVTHVPGYATEAAEEDVGLLLAERKATAARG